MIILLLRLSLFPYGVYAFSNLSRTIDSLGQNVPLCARRDCPVSSRQYNCRHECFPLSSVRPEMRLLKNRSYSSNVPPLYASSNIQEREVIKDRDELKKLTNFEQEVIDQRIEYEGLIAHLSLTKEDLEHIEEEFEPYLFEFDPVQPDEIAHDIEAKSLSKVSTSDKSEECLQGTKEQEMSSVWNARLLVLVAAALYGTNFTMVKILDESVPVAISTMLRFGMASLVTLPWFLAPIKEKTRNLYKEKESIEETRITNRVENQEKMIRNKRNMGDQIIETLRNPTPALSVSLAGMEIGMWVAVGYIAQAIGLQTTEASKSAFICSLAVVIVPILDFLNGKQIQRREIIGALMAVIGVAFLELGGGGEMAGNKALSLGDAASLLQPIMFGLGFWRMEAAMKRFPEEAMRLTAGQLFTVFLISAICCIFSPEGVPEVSQIMAYLSDPTIIGILFWTGLVTTALTVSMETMALKTISAAETTMIFSTEPLFGAAFAAFVVGERFGVGDMIGAVLILGGCVLAMLDSTSSRRESDS